MLFWVLILAAVQVLLLMHIIERLEENARNFMVTQKELVDQLAQVRTDLVAANAEITKVSADQDTLLKQVADLQAALANQPNATDELVAAVQAVADQATIVKTGIQAVDDKVPEVPPAP